MYLKTVCLLWGILLLNFYAVLAQKKVAVDSSSTHHLQEVTISGKIPVDQFATARKVEVDSQWVQLMPQASLTELLGHQSPVFMRQYGVGALSTPAIRGSNNSQSTILWNGLNLQSPMNGTADLSLITVAVADKVAIQYGGASARQGTAVVGGAILIDNSPKFASGLNVSGRAFSGSFSKWGHQYSISYGSKKWYTSTKFFQQEAQNDFPYKNLNEPNQPVVNQFNNQTKQKGIIQEISWKPDSAHALNARFWYQENDRQIPPVMGVVLANQSQQDQNFRSMVDFEKKINNLKIIAKGAFFSENLTYNDPQLKLISLNKAFIWIGDVASVFTLDKHLIGVGFQSTFNRSNTTNYGGILAKQDRYTFYANYRFTSSNGRFIGIVNGREEMVNGVFIPFVFASNASYFILPKLSITISASRNYRLPTLNDLYWVPGGNLNLKPEDAWMQDINLKYSFRRGHLISEFELVGFNTIVNQAIVWLPNSSGIYSPKNLTQTWSRGTEFSWKPGIYIGNWRFSGNFQYHFTRSTILSSDNDSEIGKQVAYIPLHTGVAGLTIGFKGVTLNYSQTLTSLRYSTSDESQWVDGYSLGNATIAYQSKLKNWTGNIYLQVNNIWNVDYQVLTQRPMPGINFQLGVTILFSKPLTKQFN